MEEKERVEAEERRKKNPLEKIAEMTVEMAKLVLVVQALSGIKKDGKEQGFAEISDEKLSNIIGIDKSRIGGKNGLIFEAVQKGYICAANAKTNEPLLDKDGKEMAVKLSLNWSGEEPLKEKELSELKPLYVDYMYWDNSLDMNNVEVDVPEKYIFVGNVAPIMDESSDSYSYGWGSGDIVYRQLKWQDIPKEKRDAFKAADKSEEKVIFEGNECRISRRNMSDEWSHFEDVLSLRVFPCLSHLTLHKWYKNLYEYLEGYPFLRELELNNHGQKKLDFSKSYIDRLSVDMTGVEELVLNDGMEHLILFGEVSDNCKIRTEDNGSTLILYVDGKLPRLSGLDNLESLHIRSIMKLDIEEVLSRYPDLLELRLWGKPGNLINFDKLSGFSKLRFFSTMELFGFSEKDIPEPECFPNLCSLWMDSLPEDAAKMVKKLYKNRAKEGLHLWITKARKPEWLAQNLDNPFRSWDGREGITPSNAKKAADLYRKTRAQVVKLIEGPTSDFEQDIEALVRTYAEGFNKMDKRKYFITTIERDEVFDALSDILGLIPDELGLDKNRMIDIFDDVKEF